MNTLTVGCGAGFSGDRTDVAAPLVRTLIARGGPAALVFENLAERTLAQQQLTRRTRPELGYEPLLDEELRPVLADCVAHGITVVGNFGAANPQGAAQAIHRLARELGLPPLRIAIVVGDDLSDAPGRALVAQHLGGDLAQHLGGGLAQHLGGGLAQHLGGDFDAERFVCANAYQGAFEIAAAIQAGAQVVVTGRVADPSLVLGPAIAHYGWRVDDWDVLAGATMAGHLLECGAQVSGGYFADPGRKDVLGLDDVGFPWAEIFPDGSCIVGKADDTGGCVDCRTVKEQLLYEVHDPAAYVTPDVVADVSAATVTQVGPDRVRLAGVRGHPRTDTLKALAYFDNGWLGEAEISYAGPNAEARARLARDVIARRLGPLLELRFDLIGVVSILGDDGNCLLDATPSTQTPDVRLRVAARHRDVALIDRLLREVTALWTCGPAGGGGVRTAKRQRLANRACLIPRDALPAGFRFIEAEQRP